jgi:hypothetical protein
MPWSKAPTIVVRFISRTFGRLASSATTPAAQSAPALPPTAEGLGIQPPAHAEIFIRQHDPRARPPRRQGRHQPRRPGADDQQIAMQEPLVIGIVRVFLVSSPTQARRAADDRLIKLFPERRRPHEGLVVEARREEGDSLSLIAMASNRKLGQRFWLVASSPSNSSATVARVFGSCRAPVRSSTSAFGSSDPAEIGPRGR